jgi:hypothetical protein
MVLMARTTKTAEERRKARIRAIHAERRRTPGLDDGTYRDLLEAEFGVRSSKDLSNTQMRELLSIFRAWNGPRDGAEKRQEAALRERAREIAERIPDGEARLVGLVQRFFGVQKLEWAFGVKKLERLLAALGKIEREGL